MYKAGRTADRRIGARLRLAWLRLAHLGRNLACQEAAPETAKCQITIRFSRVPFCATLFQKMQTSKNRRHRRFLGPPRRAPGGAQSPDTNTILENLIFCTFPKKHYIFEKLKNTLSFAPKTWSSRRGHKSTFAIVIRCFFSTCFPPKFRASPVRAH